MTVTSLFVRGLLPLAIVLASACGSVSLPRDGGGGGSGGAGGLAGAGGEAGGGGRAGGGGQAGAGGGQAGASGDAGLACSYTDGGAFDASGPFQAVCPAAGCPGGMVCVVEIGGAAGFGGEYCAPIPLACHGTPSCACMAACVCTNPFAGTQPATCSDQDGTITCDNGTR